MSLLRCVFVYYSPWDCQSTSSGSSSGRFMPEEYTKGMCVCATIFGNVSFHIHSLSNLNCCITSGSSRQEVMGQVLFSYINLTTVLWAVSSFFFPNAYNSAEKCNVFIYGSSRYKSNIILLHILIALLPSKCCNTDSTSVMSGAYTCCVNSWILDTFTQHMSPTLNASYALQRFERGNATCNRMMFDFYLGLPHIHLFTHSL